MQPNPKQIKQFSSVPQKTTPVAADRLLIDDSAATYARKYSLLSAILAQSGIALSFGASMGGGDVGKYFQPNGIANGGKFNTLTEESQLTCPISGTIEVLAWIAAGSPITNAVLKIWINGVVQKTVTVSDAGASPTKGISAGLNTSVTAGDLIAIEYDAVGTGAAFGKSVLELFVRGV